MKDPADISLYQGMVARSKQRAKELAERLEAIPDIQNCAFKPNDLQKDLEDIFYDVEKSLPKSNE